MCSSPRYPVNEGVLVAGLHCAGPVPAYPGYGAWHVDRPLLLEATQARVHGNERPSAARPGADGHHREIRVGHYKGIRGRHYIGIRGGYYRDIMEAR